MITRLTVGSDVQQCANRQGGVGWNLLEAPPTLVIHKKDVRTAFLSVGWWQPHSSDRWWQLVSWWVGDSLTVLTTGDSLTSSYSCPLVTALDSSWRLDSSCWFCSGPALGISDSWRPRFLGVTTWCRLVIEPACEWVHGEAGRWQRTKAPSHILGHFIGHTTTSALVSRDRRHPNHGRVRHLAIQLWEGLIGTRWKFAVLTLKKG